MGQNWLFLSQRETDSGPTQEESTAGPAAMTAIAEGSRTTRASQERDAWPRRECKRPPAPRHRLLQKTFADEFLIAGPLGGRLRC